MQSHANRFRLVVTDDFQNHKIGKNLHLHPCYMAAGFFREDTRPWEGMFEQSLLLNHARPCIRDSDKELLGTIISSYCSEFENLDGKGHGVNLETTNMTVRRYPNHQVNPYTECVLTLYSCTNP